MTARFLIAFVVAVVALRELWAVLREVVRGPGTGAWPWAMVWGLVLLASFLYAGFVVYTAERKTRRLRRRLALYEWFLAGGHR